MNNCQSYGTCDANTQMAMNVNQYQMLKLVEKQRNDLKSFHGIKNAKINQFKNDIARNSKKIDHYSQYIKSQFPDIKLNGAFKKGTCSFNPEAFQTAQLRSYIRNNY